MSNIAVFFKYFNKWISQIFIFSYIDIHPEYNLGSFILSARRKLHIECLASEGLHPCENLQEAVSEGRLVLVLLLIKAARPGQCLLCMKGQAVSESPGISTADFTAYWLAMMGSWGALPYLPHTLYQPKVLRLAREIIIFISSSLSLALSDSLSPPIFWCISPNLLSDQYNWWLESLPELYLS